MTYTVMPDNTDAALMSLTTGLVFWLVADGPLPESKMEGRLQVPLMGSAIVMAYHLSTLNATTDTLVPLSCLTQS